ncbi:ubiquitin-conjugating enzyme E2 Z-like [Dermacentor albipictus]|uniref:ubiquitin-conjugating enzyme E2 Z-like n=1 Tax=Dermacentor albipictus TaxID=60249 RepID=UPI0031FCA9CE
MFVAQEASPAAPGKAGQGIKSAAAGPFKRDDAPSFLTRVKNDIADIFADPAPGIFIEPDENDVSRIHALVVGPSGTPYEGGFFEFLIKCPPEYPYQPPTVKFLTTGCGKVRFNPNLNKSGSICLNILGTGWSPAQCLASVLISIQSLLNEDPIYNEPGIRKGQMVDLASSYNAVVEYQTIRVAVCDNVEACLEGTSSLPSTLRDVAVKKFSEFYEHYEAVLKPKLHLSGNKMDEWYYNHTGTFEYAELLTRLKNLKQKVENLQD